MFAYYSPSVPSVPHRTVLSGGGSAQLGVGREGGDSSAQPSRGNTGTQIVEIRDNDYKPSDFHQICGVRKSSSHLDNRTVEDAESEMRDIAGGPSHGPAHQFS